MSAISLFVATLLSLNAPQAPCDNDCLASDAGLQLIQHFEGFSPVVYKDIAGYDTIGIGHLIKPGERFDEPMLPEEAYQLLKRDVRGTERSVNRLVRVPMQQNQADAVISFTYNLGSGALEQSTLLRRINAKRYDDAAPQFLLWNKAFNPRTKKKEVSRGLTIRREAEKSMYCGD